MVHKLLRMGTEGFFPMGHGLALQQIEKYVYLMTMCWGEYRSSPGFVAVISHNLLLAKKSILAISRALSVITDFPGW